MRGAVGGQTGDLTGYPWHDYTVPVGESGLSIWCLVVSIERTEVPPLNE